MLRKWIAATLTSLALSLLGMAQFVNAGDDCCDTGCKVKKTCHAEVEVKPKAIVHYGDRCIDFCLPKCVFGGLFKKKKGCDDCSDRGDCTECHKCECRARTRKVLLKKTRYEDECRTKCVVVEECEPVCQPTQVCVPEAACAPACERAPLFKKKEKFCCPDYSNPYAGTALDPNAAPAEPAGKMPEPLPAPKKEEAKPEPKGAASLLPDLKLGEQQ
jgi:hypothetical protein